MRIRARGWATAIGLLAAALTGGAPGAAVALADDDVGIVRAVGKGTLSSRPDVVAELPNGVALLTADDGVHGEELWRTDGTAGGTLALGDLVPGPGSSFADTFSVGDDGVAGFVAYSGGLGAPELWRTDGTPAGTRRAASLTGLAATDVLTLVPWRGGYAFSYITADRQERLGYAGADGAVRELAVGVADEQGRGAGVQAVLGDTLYFDYQGQLWATDGTLAGTRQIQAPGASGLTTTVIAGDRLAAYYYNGGLHPEVGVVDGTSYTRLGEMAPMVQHLDAIGDRVFFTGEDGTRTWAPGESVRTFTSVQAATPFTDLGHGAALFGAQDAGGVYRLYRTDATATGATAVDGHLVVAGDVTVLGGGRAVVPGYDDRAATPAPSLRVTDGTAAGTRDLGAPGPREGASASTAHGVVYAGADHDLGVELFRTDGTAAGTGLLADLDRVPRGSGPLDATRVGDRVVFRTDLDDDAVWATDGTAAGTVPVFEHGIGGSAPLAGVIGGTDDGAAAYFGAGDDLLYRTDGTRAGTAAVAHVDHAAYLAPLGSQGGWFLFGRPTTSGSYGLLRTDGTLAGTAPYSDAEGFGAPYVVAKGPQSMLVQLPYNLTRTDGTAAGTASVPTYFGGNDDTAGIAVPDGFLAAIDPEGRTGFELQHLDRDGVADAPPADLIPGAQSSYPQGFSVLPGGDVLFNAYTDTEFGTQGWWVTDPRGAHPVRLDGLPGRPASGASTVGGVTYFANGEGDDTVLYRTDGTRAGTVALHRFTGASGAGPGAFTAFAGRTYFMAGDGEHGRELWVTDGTPAGTRLARDIWPGPESGDPDDLVAAGDFLFFSADDGASGPEPWRVKRTAPAGGGGGDTPVAINPLPIEPSPAPSPSGNGVAGRAAAPAAASLGAASRSATSSTARVSLTVRRLARGRWRVSGRLTGGGAARSGCSGSVRVVLGRGARPLKTQATKMKACAFSTTMTTTSRSPGRWIQVRTPSALSRRAAVR